MKIICSKESILKVLGIAESVISTKNSISILSNVLIETINGKVKISASETSLNFFAEINAEIIEEGSVSVYCNRLYSIIRKMDGDEIDIESNDQNVVSVKPKDSNKCNYNLKGIDSAKFPPIKLSDDLNFFSIKQTIFTEMTRKTIFSVSASESRRFVSGILFEKTDNNIKMISTDGKRLAFISKEVSSLNIDNYSIIVPIKILTEILKLCSDNGDIQIAFSNKNISMKIDNFNFISNLLEGNFPPYEKVIPKDQTGYLLVDKKVFYSSLDRISLMGDKESHKIILSISKNQMKIFTENIAFGSGEEIIPVEYDGEKLNIALNYSFVTEVLNVISKEKVIIEFKDPQSTITIREKDDNDYIYIMMPMSI